MPPSSTAVSAFLTAQVPLQRYPDTYNGHPLWYAAFASHKSYLSLHLMPVYGDAGLATKLGDRFRAAGRGPCRTPERRDCRPRRQSVERVWTVNIDGQLFWLAFDDHLGMSLDSKNSEASARVPSIRDALLRYRSNAEM